MQLLLQFHADSVETLKFLRSWSDICILFGYNPYFCHFFHKMNLVVFLARVKDTRCPPTDLCSFL